MTSHELYGYHPLLAVQLRVTQLSHQIPAHVYNCHLLQSLLWSWILLSHDIDGHFYDWQTWQVGCFASYHLSMGNHVWGPITNTVCLYHLVTHFPMLVYIYMLQCFLGGLGWGLVNLLEVWLWAAVLTGSYLCAAIHCELKNNRLCTHGQSDKLPNCNLIYHSSYCIMFWFVLGFFTLGSDGPLLFWEGALFEFWVPGAISADPSCDRRRKGLCLPHAKLCVVPSYRLYHNPWLISKH